MSCLFPREFYNQSSLDRRAHFLTRRPRIPAFPQEGAKRAIVNVEQPRRTWRRRARSSARRSETSSFSRLFPFVLNEREQKHRGRIQLAMRPQIFLELFQYSQEFQNSFPLKRKRVPDFIAFISFQNKSGNSKPPSMFRSCF